MPPSYRNAVSNDVTPPRHQQILVQPRPCNDDMLKILALHAANAPLDEIRDAVLAACPPPPPTTELVLETKGELRATPYNAILESLLRDQDDSPGLHAMVQAGAIVQIVKRSDGNLSFHVAANADVEALRHHRVTLCGNTYEFRSRTAIDQRFFFDVINFTVLDDVWALTQQLLTAGFKVMSCTPKICGRREKTSTPMLRVYTVDFTIPTCARVNGQPMDQIVLDGKTYTVNCRGSRSGASPRSQSPHCLVLSGSSANEYDKNDGATRMPNQSSADGDVDMSGPARTAVDLARVSAQPADFAILVRESQWISVRATRRLSESMRELPATKIAWTTENRFAALDDMEPTTDFFTWSSSQAEPPNAQYYQSALVKRPHTAERPKPCSSFTVRNRDRQPDRSTTTVAAMTVQDVECAINAARALDIPTLQQVVEGDFLAVEEVDAKLRTCPDYDEIETTLRTQPVATASTLFSYIRQRDAALEEIVDMHLFARSLAARDVTSGVPYAHEVRALLQIDTGITREPVAVWSQNIAAAPTEHADIIRINRALALFELLLRTMAPCVEQNDQLLMLLSGVQVHWLPTLNDRFLHPATLLAIAATEVGRDIIDVGLLNDDSNPLLCLLRDGIDDDSLLRSWLANDLALEATIEAGCLTANVVSGLAQVLACNRNANHSRDKFCAQQLFKHYHVTCLQETSFSSSHDAKTFQAQVNAEYKNTMFVNDRGTSSDVRLHGKHGGVCTILHTDFSGSDTATHMAELDVPDRYMVVQVKWGQTDVYIHNVYAPAQAADRAAFFESLPRSFVHGGIHIVCGDLNSPLNPALDAHNPSTVHIASNRALLEWTWDLGVTDPWRIHHPDDRAFSGPGRVNRLDYILVSHCLQEKYFSAAQYSEPQVRGVTVSDHLMPSLTLKAVACDTKPGPWRAAKWLLEDPDVQTWIVSFIKLHATNVERADDPGRAWNRLMRALRAQLMQRQRSYTQPSQIRVRECVERLAALMRDTSSTADDIRDAEATLEAACGEHERVRADLRFKRDLVENETGSSFFFRPPSNSLNRNPISTARDPNGVVTSVPMWVQHHHWKFWSKVFDHDGRSDVEEPADEREVAQSELFSNTSARVAEEDRETLDADLTTEEFVTAIKSMSPYKAPGLDGIPAKVYQLDPLLFARLLVRVFDHQAGRGSLLLNQRRSIVCLLFKKGDRSDPANYRPISLIPVDLKIYARVLTNRLRPLMTTLIHQDQSGFIKGRHIQHPLVTMYDLQESVTARGGEAYATMIDFEKAYDRVNWEYLWATLRHFGFGERFIQFVRIMYTNSEVQLNVNGNLLEPIRPSRGVKQGDPLSPLLFVLAMEPLCCAIRKRADLGLQLPGLPAATGMYFADDATLLSDSLANAEKQLDIVQQYCAASGAKLNINKTTCLALNRNQTQHTTSRIRVLGPEESVRYLGMPVGQNIYHNDRLTSVNAKFFSCFAVWKWRARTLQGRTVIARALLASQLWYCSSVTCIPDPVTKSWQRALNNYIVRAQTDPCKGPLMVASEWLYNSPGQTTLRLPNVKRFIQRQRLNLLQQLVRARERPPTQFGWHSIPLRQLVSLVPYSRCDTTSLDALWLPFTRQWFDAHPGALTSWWVDVLTTWHAWTKMLNVETLPPREQQQLFLTAPIWHNKYTLWQYQTGGSRQTARPLWRSSNPLVRRELAQNGFSSLQDFLAHDLRWPTLEEFAAIVYCATQLREPQSRNVAFLYHQLSQTFHRLFPNGVETSLLDEQRDRIKPLLPWYASTPRKRHWFPHIPSKALANALAAAESKTPTSRHPFQRHSLANTPSTSQLRDHANSLRSFIDPRTLDVTLRIWWRILPTHYFFWRQHSDTQLRHCAHGCTSIETYRHLFWECQHSRTLWTLVLRQWPNFLTRPIQWHQVLFGLDLPLKTRWKQHSNSVILTWNITRSIVFASIWKNRNHFKHRHEAPPHPVTQWHWIDSRRRQHLRYALRRAIVDDDTDFRDGLIRIASVFAQSPLVQHHTTLPSV